MYCGVDVVADLFVGEVGERKAASTATGADFFAAVLFGNDGNGQADKGTYVCSDGAISAGDEDDVVFGGKACHDLDNAGVFGARHVFNFFKEGNFAGAVHAVDGVEGRVEPVAFADLVCCGLRSCNFDAFVFSAGGNGAHCTGRV